MAQKQLVLISYLSPAGVFSLNVPVEALFFVGNQLIATSHTGKVGVWNAVTKHWQVGGDALGSKISLADSNRFVQFGSEFRCP